MGAARLTVAECDEIRELHDDGKTIRQIAKATGRHTSTVGRVLDGTVTGDGPGPGRVARIGMVEATIVPWAPWVPEPDVCAERVAELSVSERHALELLAVGYTPKQAARLRKVSPSTLRNQLNTAVQRLNVSGYQQCLIVLRRAQSAA